MVSGGLALGGLFALTHTVQLDSVLVASQAIFNVISGVKGVVMGIGQLLLGLVQMLGFAALAVVAVIAVLAVVSGSVRIGTKLVPQLEFLWNLLTHGLNGLTRLVILPRRSDRGHLERGHKGSPDHSTTAERHAAPDPGHAVTRTIRQSAPIRSHQKAA
ncbi:hypothetical protein [Synechococcus sp. GFB01]|uniref:hypothetical protein n=1 Tax=Synechococcus sp. GFB01 TaxID=1662190 RepID=UPI00064E95A4|nr:hypothetical protein [Synechococcus sp. GFB01]KMM16610.1 hypothetical protein SYNGFB01_09970 [Synechococcus sp. GFB01]